MKQTRKTGLWAVASVLLAAGLLLVLFAGWSVKAHEAEEIGDDDSAAIPVEDASAAGADGAETDGAAAVSDGFVVSDKTYAYGENNLTVLHVENRTDKNYSVTIHGVYLDENGETLREETKTFAGFAAGWQNDFFFIPEIAFDRFTYTLETTEYDGVCLAQYYTPVWSAGEATVFDAERENRDFEAFDAAYFAETGEHFSYQGSKEALLEAYPDFPITDNYKVEGAYLSVGFAYDSPVTVEISRSAVVLSADGEVLFACNWPARIALKAGSVSAEDGMHGGVSLIADYEEDVPLLEAIKNGEELTVLLGISMIRSDEPGYSME